jgi:hypothetical protein
MKVIGQMLMVIYTISHIEEERTHTQAIGEKEHWKYRELNR